MWFHIGNRVLNSSSASRNVRNVLWCNESFIVLIARQLVMAVDRLPLHFRLPSRRKLPNHFIEWLLRKVLENPPKYRPCSRHPAPILAHYFIRAVITGCFSSGTEYKGDLAPYRKKKKRRSPHWKFSALTSLVRHLTRADSTMVDSRLKKKKNQSRN